MDALTDTVIAHDRARLQFHMTAVKFDFSFLSTPVLLAFAKACNFIDRIFRRHGGNDRPDVEEGELIVKDSRSGNIYNVPIRKGSVDAMQFRQMITTSKFSTILGQPAKGQLKVLDIGYQNTACAESDITFVLVVQSPKTLLQYLLVLVTARTARFSSEDTISWTFTEIIVSMKWHTC